MGRDRREDKKQRLMSRERAIMVAAVGLLLILLTVAGTGQAAPGEAPPLIPAPQQTLRIAVTPPGYDNIGSVLTAMGYSWTEIQWADLEDYSVLSQYDIVFINCIWQVSSTPASTTALQGFVQNGGSLYASDLAFEYIRDAFPDHINFPDFPEVGDAQTVTADIVDPGLANYLDPTNPPSTIQLRYDMDAWVVIDGVSSATTVHLRGSFTINGGTVTMTKKPLTVSFLPYGSSGGRVTYTTFHHEAQQTGVERKLLEYLVLIPTTSELQEQVRQAIQAAGCVLTQMNINTINPGQANSASYTGVVRGKRLCIVLSWPGSTLKLSLYDPGSNLYGEQESSTPPISIVVPSADAGDWRYEVTGVDVPYTNYPYVVGIGQSAYYTYLPLIMKNY